MNREEAIGALYAIKEWLEAEKEETDALKAYTGYEWGYHGHREIERSEKAREKAISALMADREGKE